MHTLDLRKPHQIPRAGRPQREADSRVGDDQPIKTSFPAEGAESQAARCAVCHSPSCGGGCPLKRDIPGINQALAAGNRDLAFERMKGDIFALLTEQVCPQGKLCEASCIQEVTGHRAVTIGDNILTVALDGMAKGKYVPPFPVVKRDQKIVIVGSGPGGLKTAWDLCEQGFQVEVIERQDEPGGQLVYGIPNFKLDKQYPQLIISMLKEAGVKFTLNCEVVGENLENLPEKKSFSDLKAEYDEIILATGLYAAHKLDVPGADLPQVKNAFYFLKGHTQERRLGKNPELFDKNMLNVKGQDVAVLGGGDTAMDVARTAARRGAKSVTVFYRGSKERMPAYTPEQEAALAEGVIFVYNTTPKKISEINKNRLQIVFDKTSLAGDQKTLNKTGEEVSFEADAVFPAFGFDIKSLGISTLEKGRLEASRGVDARQLNYATTDDRVWAIGDIIKSNSLVVHAIRDGRDLAEQIVAKYPVQSQEPRDRVMALLREQIVESNHRTATP